jgi:hypothetical protein
MRLQLLTKVVGRLCRPPARGMSVGAMACCGALICLTGCGHHQTSSGVHASGEAASLPQANPMNWANPILGEVQETLPQAQASVPFRLTAIPSLPSPRRIFVTPGRSRSMTVIVLQYMTPQGLVNEYEELPQLTQSQFNHMISYWVALNGKPGTEGTSTAVTLDGKYAGLVTTNASGSTSDIRWVEAGVEYKIRGPSLTERYCVLMADRLASAVMLAH